MSLEFFKNADAALHAIDPEKLKKALIEHSFWIHLNANDTFYYASADATQVELHDLPKLIEMYDMFGDDGVLAFQAHLRNEQPLKQLITNGYKKAKAYIKDWKPFEIAAKEAIEQKYNKE